MLRCVALATCFLPFLIAPAEAVTVFTSGATDTSVHISIAGTVVADAAVGTVSGTAAPAYDASGGAASINQSFTLTSGVLGTATQALQSGLVSTRANSDGVSFATGTATLANASSILASKLLGDLVPVAALGVTAGAITSTTNVGIDAGGALFGSGSSTIASLGITGSALGLLSIDGSVYTAPAVNTVVLSLTGLKVMLNEQLRSTTANSLFLQTNAVHISLDNYSLAGKLLSGDVILGHSEASVTAVPEPMTWGTMVLGFGAIGFAMRRRRAPLALA